MNKKKKIILIVSLSLVGVLITYFGSGLIVTSVIEENLINVRGSDESSLEDYFYKVQYTRDDYPFLSNREEISFSYNKETLQGYLYEASNPKGIVITAHGVNSLADGDHAQYQNYFIEKGYDVFSFDMVGCGRSTGKGMKSLFESRYCVDEAINRVKELEQTKDLPIFLVGHSWGAYGVLASTEDHNDIKAVASFSGYNQPAEMMYGFAENYVSKALILTKPSLYFSLGLLHGNKSFFKASEAIAHNPDIDYILIHGENDDVVPLEHYSVINNVNDLDNVNKIILKDFKHEGPWKSLEAISYYENELEPKIEELKNQYDGNIPDEIFNDFLSSVDKDKASELNLEVLDYIESQFASKL